MQHNDQREYAKTNDTNRKTTTGLNKALVYFFAFTLDSKQLLERIKKTEIWLQKCWREVIEADVSREVTHDDAIRWVRKSLQVELKKYPTVYKKHLFDGTLLTSEEKKIESAYRKVMTSTVVMIICSLDPLSLFFLLPSELIILIAACTAEKALLPKSFAMDIARQSYQVAISMKPDSFKHLDKLIQKIASTVYADLQIDLIRQDPLSFDDKYNISSEGSERSENDVKRGRGRGKA